ncbi:MAG: DNA repair protein RecN [Acidimicrobiales bacterium]
MLVELRVRNLGVIEDATLELGRGMTAVTGETGAGKTLVVEALELLVGGRADPTLVRAGAEEAIVEGRFEHDDREHQQAAYDDDDDGQTLVARAIRNGGRSRAWLNSMMSTVSALSEAGARLVDLHGQHAHQSLLDAASQRAALDSYGNIDLGPLNRARARVRTATAELERLGGDEKERARESDLLRYQIEEITSAHITGATEDDELWAEELRLSAATDLRAAASLALDALDAEGPGASDAMGRAVAALDGHDPLAELSARVLGLQADAADIASELRKITETWEDDPERLAAVSQRRARLADLRRKYGNTTEEVIAFGADAEARLVEVESTEERAALLETELVTAREDLATAEAAVAKARKKAAPRLAASVQTNLRELAMPQARIEIAVGDNPAGDEVTFMLGANAGEPALPLSKVASGGELARTMLALRAVVAGGRPTLVFDEVDAGIGGAAAEAVGHALHALGEHAQVLVVTHLPQVAAFAESHFVVEKKVRVGRTIATVRQVEGDQRVAELARMLSGRPASTSARQHAEELLHEASKVRVAAGSLD